ncbi:DNA repair protein RecN [Emticicia sp. 21SJ11W-3]|uniref:DNA repair protein RecN n=1 Tax=Emticicia sp. 21SJ11W-3 TaxID=2916755 RepID=UPI00209E05AE|nr:DNA repair protein RecN [Emticicia sp. 21SJ11W-3]UTA68927.1 DNA repair protein RecN [Emticicia sp. 21SJ11W-3]
MLSNLLIKNYALIEQLEISPDAHLNIVTGETGAGKSIMLGAIGLLLGNRADVKTLYNETEKCVIEGTFSMDGFYIKNIFDEEELDFENPCIIRREIAPSGKSRAFINDTPVTLETLRKITSQLMDIHSQHDTIQLGSNEYQLTIVDTYAQCHDRLVEYQEKYRTYRKLQDAYEQLQTDADQNKKEFEFNSFQLDELVKAKLEASEQEQLEQELNILEHAEEVKLKLRTAHAFLTDTDNAVLSALQSVVGNLNSIAGFSPEYQQFKDRIQSCLVELKDVARDIETEEEGIELDSEQIETTQSRLDLLFKLQQKHGVKSNAELLEIQAVLEEKVSKVLNLSENLAAAKERVDKAYETALNMAEGLSAARQKILPEIEKRVVGLLMELGMPNSTLKIQHQTGKLTTDGIDQIHFLFSANKGITPRQLKDVASGGEFSRLMLAIKYVLGDKRSLPTIIFDEIDTGISGEVAIKVGKMMLEMAQSLQVIAITHLHQIAGRGTSHFYVYKDNSSSKTMSRIRQLNTDERIIEIAKMIGGENPSESAIHSAIEILGISV